jgi:nucleoid DNA-binding protein
VADRLLIDQILIGTGQAEMSREAAENMADRVIAAMEQLLKAGRYVRLPGIGRLTSQKKPHWVPGHKGKRAFEKRTVKLADPAVLERGEPYDTQGTLS